VVDAPWLAGAPTLDVDLSQVLAEGVSDKLGLALNFVRQSDSAALHTRIRELGLKALRFQEGELGDYWMLDAKSPNQARISVNDSSFWVAAQAENGLFRASMQVDDFASLVGAVGAQAYMIVGIDAVLYRGTADQKLAAMTDAQRKAWLKSAAVDLVLYAKSKGSFARYWEIGNESDIGTGLSSSQLGDSVWSASAYASYAKELATAMKGADPTIRVGVNGGLAGGGAWFAAVLPAVSGSIDFVVTHQYPDKSLGYQEWSAQSEYYETNWAIKDTVAALKAQALNLPIAVTEFSGIRLEQRRPKEHWEGLRTLQMIFDALKFPEVQSLQFWTSMWFGDQSEQCFRTTDTLELTPPCKALEMYSSVALPLLAAVGTRGPLSYFVMTGPASAGASLIVLNRATSSQPMNVSLRNGTTASLAHRWELRADGDRPDGTTSTLGKVAVVRAGDTGEARTLGLEFPPMSATAIVFPEASGS
jgi:hypothetical protein